MRFEGAGLDGVMAKDLERHLRARQAHPAQGEAQAHRRLRRRRLPHPQERRRRGLAAPRPLRRRRRPPQHGGGHQLQCGAAQGADRRGRPLRARRPGRPPLGVVGRSGRGRAGTGRRRDPDARPGPPLERQEGHVVDGAAPRDGGRGRLRARAERPVPPRHPPGPVAPRQGPARAAPSSSSRRSPPTSSTRSSGSDLRQSVTRLPSSSQWAATFFDGCTRGGSPGIFG